MYFISVDMQTNDDVKPPKYSPRVELPPYQPPELHTYQAPVPPDCHDYTGLPYYEGPDTKRQSDTAQVGPSFTNTQSTFHKTDFFASLKAGWHSRWRPEISFGNP